MKKKQKVGVLFYETPCISMVQTCHYVFLSVLHTYVNLIQPAFCEASEKKFNVTLLLCFYLMPMCFNLMLRLTFVHNTNF